jgi:hypothetical protein
MNEDALICVTFFVLALDHIDARNAEDAKLFKDLSYSSLGDIRKSTRDANAHTSFTGFSFIVIRVINSRLHF